MATGIFNTVRVSADGVAIAVLSALLAFLIQARLGAARPRAGPGREPRRAGPAGRGVRPAARRGRPAAPELRPGLRRRAAGAGGHRGADRRADLRAARQARRRARRRPGHGLSVRPAPGACVPPGPARPLAARRCLPPPRLRQIAGPPWRALRSPAFTSARRRSWTRRPSALKTISGTWSRPSMAGPVRRAPGTGVQRHGPRLGRAPDAAVGFLVGRAAGHAALCRHAHAHARGHAQSQRRLVRTLAGPVRPDHRRAAQPPDGRRRDADGAAHGAQPLVRLPAEPRSQPAAGRAAAATPPH